MAEWVMKKLKDIADFNPRESLAKGVVAKKIAMDKLQPFCRDIPGYELEPFSGGTKFRNGDTIMARITPCLENGKTAKVAVLDDGEVGFGSTEYIVFRAKDGVDEDFIYYLVCSPLVRGPAIKSMVGSSGRQRVQTDVVQNMEIMVPNYEEQKRISGLLKSLDEKIAANTEVNKNLEQQLASLFAHAFADNIADATTETCPLLGDLITVIDNRGKTPPLTTDVYDYPIIDVGALKGTGRIVDFNNCTKYVEQSTYATWFRSGHPQPWDILISTVGSLAEMKIYLGSKGCMAQNVVAFRATSISPLYLYQYLRFIRADLVAYNIGSVQPSIKVTHIIKHPIFVPENTKLERFEVTAKAITNRLYANYNENESLKALRDTLLPRLMSGELDISDLDL